MVSLFNIKEKQDTYIVGMDFDGNALATVYITDDFCSVGVSNGNKTYYIETEGAAYIITKEELLKHKARVKLIYDEGSTDDMEYILLKNFSGNIGLQAITQNGIDVLTHENYDADEMVNSINFELEDDDYLRDTIIFIMGEDLNNPKRSIPTFSLGKVV